MSYKILPADIFNRVNESKLLAQDEGIKPVEWAQRKVSYYDKQILESRMDVQKEFNQRLRDIWQAVVDHFNDTK